MALCVAVAEGNLPFPVGQRRNKFVRPRPAGLRVRFMRAAHFFGCPPASL